jgi:hypothetical protein
MLQDDEETAAPEPAPPMRAEANGIVKKTTLRSEDQMFKDAQADRFAPVLNSVPLTKSVIHQGFVCHNIVSMRWVTDGQLMPYGTALICTVTHSLEIVSYLQCDRDRKNRIQLTLLRKMVSLTGLAAWEVVNSNVYPWFVYSWFIERTCARETLQPALYILLEAGHQHHGRLPGAP